MEIKIEKTNNLELELGMVQVYPSLEDLNIKPSGKKQIFNHPNSYGYDNVVVEAVASDELNIKPSFEQQKYEGLFNTVKVDAMSINNEKWYIEENEIWT